MACSVKSGQAIWNMGGTRLIRQRDCSVV